MLIKLKKIFYLWKLLDLIELDKESNFIFKGEAGELNINSKGVKLEIKEELRLNSKLLLLNCEEDFDPIENKREELIKKELNV